MIKVILKPEKGIQIDETKKYLFDPSVVQPYVDASAENATKAEEQANRAEQTFANVSAFVDTSKSEITGIIEQGKTEITTAIDDGRMEISDSILEATEEVKKAGAEAAQEAVQGAANEATRIATEQVNTYVVEVVSPQIQEFVNNAEADASNAAESAGLAAEEANKSSVFASDSQHYAEDARIWAEGEQAEVKPLGGELSSMGWALQASNSATSASQSATQAKTSGTNAKSYADSVNPDRFLNKVSSESLIINGITDAGQIRFVAGDYGVIFRQDSSNFYVLLTNKGDPYGEWNSFRPLIINLETGKQVSAGKWAMPSSKYTNLTLGSSGSKYTAPANGWFCLRKNISAAGQYGQMVSSRGIAVSSGVHTVGWAGFIPCQKGDEVTITYNLGGNTSAFVFIYAEGEN